MFFRFLPQVVHIFLLILQMSDEKSSGGEFINVAETKMYGTKAVIKADIAPYNSKVGINRLINRCCRRYCNGEQ